MRQRLATVLLALLMVSPCACCFLPKDVFMYVRYGRPALTREQYDSIDSSMVGLTTDQVRERLGPPHDRTVCADGSETWIYWNDPLDFTFIGIHFDEDKRFRDCWI